MYVWVHVIIMVAYSRSHLYKHMKTPGILAKLQLPRCTLRFSYEIYTLPCATCFSCCGTSLRGGWGPFRRQDQLEEISHCQYLGSVLILPTSFLLSSLLCLFSLSPPSLSVFFFSLSLLAGSVEGNSLHHSPCHWTGSTMITLQCLKPQAQITASFLFSVRYLRHSAQITQLPRGRDYEFKTSAFN